MNKQVTLFTIVGFIQYIIDCGLFIFFSNLNVDIETANVLCRCLAAITGFSLNRTLTFRYKGTIKAHIHVQAIRFIILWAALTVISTVLIILVNHLFPGEDSSGNFGILAIGKLIIEALLAVVSFIISKFWVYSYKSRDSDSIR